MKAVFELKTLSLKNCNWALYELAIVIENWAEWALEKVRGLFLDQIVPFIFLVNYEPRLWAWVLARSICWKLTLSFQFDFGNCNLTFQRIVIETTVWPQNMFEYFEVTRKKVMVNSMVKLLEMLLYSLQHTPNWFCVLMIWKLLYLIKNFTKLAVEFLIKIYYQ